MSPKMILAVSIAILPAGITAAEWKELSGTYAVTAENYLDPGEGEPANSHFRLQLDGSAAEDLYAAIPGDPVEDECTGGQAKSIGELRCIHYTQDSRYECAFSIDLLEQKIEYGVAC